MHGPMDIKSSQMSFNFCKTDVFLIFFSTTITLLNKNQHGTHKFYFASNFIQFYYDSSEVISLKAYYKYYAYCHHKLSKILVCLLRCKKNY